jgi:hypothetical protein
LRDSRGRFGMDIVHDPYFFVEHIHDYWRRLANVHAAK